MLHSWYSLRLHTRMLLGYGLMFALIAGLAFFLLIRSNALNAQIRQVNAEVTTEATTGAQIEAQVAAAQQAIDRYLQQPLPEHLRTANAALDQLDATVSDAQDALTSSQQRQQVADLASQVERYRNSFHTLSSLLDTQATLRSEFNQRLFDASLSLNTAITTYLNGDAPDLRIVTSLAQAQAKLQLASLWSARLVNEQRQVYGQNALDELAVADFNLKTHRDALNQLTGPAIDAVLDNIALAMSGVSQYAEQLTQMQTLRDTLLDEQGEQLKAQAGAIATAALSRLTNATSSLEQQSLQTQQLTAVALTVTLLLTALFGGWIPRTITRPLRDLMGATSRINQGDYTVAMATRDRSELGELAEAFNQMAATLSLQRDEVQQQQATLAERNQALERTLDELQTSVAAREQLARTVRLLSVPVVPLLAQVIMIPLVGEIDLERAELLLDRLLEGVTEQRARIAILDITGVPVVDSALVDWLLKAAISARLLGAQCILVGIGPEVAQAIVASGADLTALTTRSDLRDAVEYAIRVIRR